ncbi:L-aspartate oxidase [Salinispira pacifica]|uniref:L-aspartate oxidase n=1 Tax=Salinispira pacifica TaxID=1307761 RepID=V5WGC9_9SPIO|nr:L-aspartate oxidase [Salinispira pacifica]AHC14843.1 L-aspartate oxidase [Salinispira pacifica]
MEHEIQDVLIIGTGIAGLSAAVTAAEAGLSVTVLSKDGDVSRNNTWWAQGGIVAEGIDDNPELLAKDIMEAGSRINNVQAVNIVAQEGPELVHELLINKAGVPFERGKDGNFDRTREGAHSLRRIFHVKDQTGRAIQEHLMAYAAGLKNISFLPGMVAVDLITNTHHSTDPQQRYKKRKVLGAYVLDETSGEITPVFSPSVILATGGVGSLYLHTSNPASATGDGIAMAYRAGCEIINAEYIQFHPTTLYHRDAQRFLMTEALRGEGARLMNRRGEYFMERYQPELKDLAPRDEVARAIYNEMDSSTGFVYLDARNLKVDVQQRFPGIFHRCSELDMDIRSDLIPVVPAAHYFCGGIKVNSSGRTEIKNLYAVGESAGTGVHGANRLASVSLLEGLVFGVRAARSIIKHEAKLKSRLVNSIPEWKYPPRVVDFDPLLIKHDLQNIQSTMWNYVGILRTEKRLDRALSDLNYYTHRIERFYKEARAGKEIIQLRNAVLSATIIARAAQANTESRGCHFREAPKSMNPG